MIKTELEISKEFLQEEERCGYVIERNMKELWAVSIDLAVKLISVCNKYDLKVIAIYGTLLGTVRHDGYIPWDDDIDLAMPRDDFDRLCEISKECFEEPYFWQTEKTDKGFSRDFARLRNSNTTAIQTTEAAGAKRIRYNQGVFIDIFPLDKIPEDTFQRGVYAKKYRELRDKAMKWSTWSYRYVPSSRSIKDKLKKIVADINVYVFDLLRVDNPYLKKIVKLRNELDGIDTGKYAVLWFYDSQKDNYWEKSDMYDLVNHKFEFIELNVPINSETILEREYGDWRTFVIGTNDHGDLIIDVNIPYKEYIMSHSL